MDSDTSHTACTDVHTLPAHHIALIPCTTSVAQGQPECVSRKVVSFHLSRAVSLASHRIPSTSSSTYSSVPGLQRLLTSRNLFADPRERGNDGYTDPETLTVYEPNRIVDNQIINEQKYAWCHFFVAGDEFPNVLLRAHELDDGSQLFQRQHYGIVPELLTDAPEPDHEGTKDEPESDWDMRSADAPDDEDAGQETLALSPARSKHRQLLHRRMLHHMPLQHKKRLLHRYRMWPIHTMSETTTSIAIVFIIASTRP